MISHIVACSQNNVIGISNQLPWHIPEDLKRFKQITLGAVVIMGRVTYESIGKALPNRQNIVLTKSDLLANDVIICNDIEDALNTAATFTTDIFIIGGDSIYQQTINMVDKIYMTRVLQKITGDASYPKIPNNFKVIEKEYHNGYNYITYLRNNNGQPK